MNTAPVGSPTLWTQYVNNKDCSQGFCTLYCPQWCYIVFPPPPPFADEFPIQASSGPNFSPLVITIIGILAAAFLLVSYYAIISKYCIQRSPPARRGYDQDENIGDNHDSADVVEPWFVTTNGLDDALIQSITIFKYNKDEWLSQGTDCSVCLSEFEEHDSLRLLPKCSHAFHVQCIDTWLKSHSNCPLCRANVASDEPSPPQSLPPDETLGHGVTENAAAPSVDHITSRETSIDIRDADEGEGGHDHQLVRRSVSMDCIRDHHIGYVLDDHSRDLDCVIKRSHSSGRWFFKNGRQRNSVIPL